MRGVRVKEMGESLEVSFKDKPIFWSRHVSDLVKDKVLIDLDNASRLAKANNQLVYKVYNLWKFVDEYKNKKVLCDLTLLRHGIFSLREDGELFETYGHLHGKKYGEVYKAIKNDCFLMLVEKRNKKCYLVELKEGKSFLIGHKFMHRLISKDKDCLVAGFLLPGTGHDYNAVKGKGFPFHLFKKNGKTIPVANTNYKNFELVTQKNKTRFDGEKLFFKNISRLEKILRTA